MAQEITDRLKAFPFNLSGTCAEAAGRIEGLLELCAAYRASHEEDFRTLAKQGKLAAEREATIDARCKDIESAREAFRAIIEMETSGANATVRRMVKAAKDALERLG